MSLQTSDNVPPEATCQEYLDELHKIVCGHCLERLKGHLGAGAPRAPAGIEMHLPRLIDALRRISKEMSSPDVACICRTFDPACPGREGQAGPCPMESLIALLVAAGEAVVQRHKQGEEEWERLLAVWDD